MEHFGVNRAHLVTKSSYVKTFCVRRVIDRKSNVERLFPS